MPPGGYLTMEVAARWHIRGELSQELIYEKGLLQMESIEEG